tara:strand:- start:243 stop:347 length:105 start_codon:yes stop_codon:yes gene_type:complete
MDELPQLLIINASATLSLDSHSLARMMAQTLRND